MEVQNLGGILRQGHKRGSFVKTVLEGEVKLIVNQKPSAMTMGERCLSNNKGKNSILTAQ